MFINYFKKVKEYISANPVTTTLLAISIIISSICVIVIPILIGNIINGIFYGESLKILKRLFLIVFTLYIVNALVKQYENYSSTTIIEGLINNIKIKMFSTIETFQESYFRNTSTKELLYIYTKDIESLRTLLINNSIAYIRSFIVLIIIIIAMFIFSIKLAVATLFLSPFIVLLFFILERKKFKLKNNEREDYIKYIQFIEDTLLNLKTIKANGLEKEKRLEFHNLNTENNKTFQRTGYSCSIIVSCLIGINLLVLSISFISGGTLIISDELSTGRLITFLLYIPLVYNSIYTIIKSYNEFLYNYTLLEKIISFIKTPIKSLDVKDSKSLSTLQGDITFDNVSVNINNKIKNLNFYIKMGSKVIMLGNESSCKEYILDLLEGGNIEYDGAIKISNVPYTNFKISDIRKRIGKLTKDPILFSGTILDNLIYGNKTISKEQVESVCKQINLYDAIMALPKGFDTEIAPGSLILNKGEFILLNIARLILKNPNIVILEEGNHNLDSSMEGKIKIALDLLCLNKTVVISTTKVNSNTSANNIFIIKNGEIVDEGDYATLSSKPSNKDVFN